MRLKTIELENFNNYKEPCMFIVTAECSWKCCKDAGVSNHLCQNHAWSDHPSVEVDNETIANKYILNEYTTSIVFGGLEPFDQFYELFDCIGELRKHTDDTIVIYTGYYKNEIEKEIEFLKTYKNIIVKFGRFIPNRPSKYDKLLGVTLASNNQYAEKIS